MTQIRSGAIKPLARGCKPPQAGRLQACGLPSDTLDLKTRRRSKDAQAHSPQAHQTQVNPTQASLDKVANLRTALGVPDAVKDLSDAAGEASFFSEAGDLATVVESVEVAGEEFGRLEHEPAAALGASKAVLGGLGVLAGSGQVIFGGHEFLEGHRRAGVADLLGGAFNSAAGASQLSARFAGTLATGFRAIGAAEGLDNGIPVAGPLAGAASVVGGVLQVDDGIRQGRWQSASVGAVKVVAGAAMTGGAFLDGTVFGAPVGVLLNAVGGAVILGTTLYEHHGAIEQDLALLGREGATLARRAFGTAVDAALP